MFAFVARVRSIRAAAANWRQALIVALTDPYRPELYYMRGPGPKWRQKHPAWKGR
jgi:hypothetical protein